jgi:hypothetical protein
MKWHLQSLLQMEVLTQRTMLRGLPVTKRLITFYGMWAMPNKRHHTMLPEWDLSMLHMYVFSDAGANLSRKALRPGIVCLQRTSFKMALFVLSSDRLFAVPTP